MDVIVVIELISNNQMCVLLPSTQLVLFISRAGFDCVLSFGFGFKKTDGMRVDASSLITTVQSECGL